MRTGSTFRRPQTRLDGQQVTLCSLRKLSPPFVPAQPSSSTLPFLPAKVDKLTANQSRGQSQFQFQFQFQSQISISMSTSLALGFGVPFFLLFSPRATCLHPFVRPVGSCDTTEWTRGARNRYNGMEGTHGSTMVVDKKEDCLVCGATQRTVEVDPAGTLASLVETL